MTKEGPGDSGKSTSGRSPPSKTESDEVLSRDDEMGAWDLDAKQSGILGKYTRTGRIRKAWAETHGKELGFDPKKDRGL